MDSSKNTNLVSLQKDTHNNRELTSTRHMRRLSAWWQKFFQLDVKSAFLNGEFKEEVYVEQPQVYIIEGKENKVYRLWKALYGLKQAPRAWNNKIDGYLLQNGFEKSPSEPSLYIKAKWPSDFLILWLYVDDLIYTWTSSKMIK